MAKMSRPGFWTDENHRHPDSKWIERPTFRQLKKDLPALMKEYGMDEATVFRSRRGDWGEWFEKYTLNDKKKLVRGNFGWM